MKPLAVLLIALCLAATSHGTDTRYYPSDVSSWATRHLVAMKEPSLLEKRPAHAPEEYRFLWLRTFHKPIAIRIWSDGVGAKMRVVRLSGAGGYDPGHIEFDRTSSVAAEDCCRFLITLSKQEIPHDEFY